MIRAMSRLIAWDTSSKQTLVVAFSCSTHSHLEPCFDKKGDLKALEHEAHLQDIQILSEMSLQGDLPHSERLLWAIHQVLEASEWKLSQVDAIGVGVGPGSFTGLRIGLTTARTLAHTLGKPLLGVSSLSIFARPLAGRLRQQDLSDPYLVVLREASQGEVYALWGRAKDIAECVQFPSESLKHLWNLKVQEQVIEPKKLLHQMNEMNHETDELQNQHECTGSKPKTPVQWFGGEWVEKGSKLDKSEFWAMFHKKLQGTLLVQCRLEAQALCLLVWEAYRKGGLQSPLEVYPRYLKASSAELNFLSQVTEQAKVTRCQLITGALFVLFYRPLRGLLAHHNMQS